MKTRQFQGETGFLEAVARFSGDIRTGALPFDYRTGQCAPVAATQLRSWGAACPTGFCPPDNLPEALGRYFAGDRSGCREIPYGIRIQATSQVAAVTTVNLERTSKITMCPTRLLTIADGAAGQWLINTIQFGNQNQIVGGPIAQEVFSPFSFQLVPMVPDCIKAGQPFTINVSLGAEAMATARNLWLVFIGPMVG